MAAYTINTNVSREAGLYLVVSRENAKRAAETPPRSALTADQYLQARVNDVLDDYARQGDRITARNKLTKSERQALGVDVDE